MPERPRVYVTRRVPQAVLDLLLQVAEVVSWDREAEAVPRAVLLREAAAAAGLLTMLSERVDAELLAAAPRLKIIANMAVGYDNIDLPALTARGVQLTNTPGAMTETTADLAWALLLAAARRIVEGQKLIDANGWQSWSPMFMVGQDVFGATLGVVGAGRIGGAILRRGTGFGMRLLYHNRHRSTDIDALGARYCGLDDLLQTADFVVVTTPLTETTRGMFGAREFSLMKPTAVFVNVARGPVIRELELAEALRAGRPWAAGLDVFEREPISADHPLLALPNLVAAPHVGSASVATRTRMATMAAANLVEVLSGRPPLNPVNQL